MARNPLSLPLPLQATHPREHTRWAWGHMHVYIHICTCTHRNTHVQGRLHTSMHTLPYFVYLQATPQTGTVSDKVALVDPETCAYTCLRISFLTRRRHQRHTQSHTFLCASPQRHIHWHIHLLTHLLNDTFKYIPVLAQLLNDTHSITRCFIPTHLLNDTLNCMPFLTHTPPQRPDWPCGPGACPVWRDHCRQHPHGQTQREHGGD